MFDWFRSRMTDAPMEKFDPRRAGSLIVAVGGAGTGKTLLTFRIALKAAYEAGLPFVAEDPNGDLGVYHKAAISRLRRMKHLTDDEQDRLDWISDSRLVRIYSQRDAGKFAGIMSEYQKRAAKSKSARAPTLYAFVDEGGVMRRDSESFWDMAVRFRNSGITGYTTVHKDTDISRVGRQAIRAVMFFRGYEGDFEFFGKTITAEEATPPMADYVMYMDSYDRTLKRWDHVKDWDKPPFCLVAPVQPTSVNPDLMKL